MAVSLAASGCANPFTGPAEPEPEPLIEQLPDGCWQLGGGATFRRSEGGHSFNSNLDGVGEADTRARVAEREANGWSDPEVNLLFTIEAPAVLQHQDMATRFPEETAEQWVVRLRAAKAHLLAMPPC